MKIEALRAQITERYIEIIEDGTLPWRRPWRQMPLDCNGESGRPYTGSNIFILDLSKLINGFGNNNWYTYNGMKRLGTGPIKGARGTQVVYFNRIVKNEGEPDERVIPIWRVYTVFNAEQAETPSLLPNRGDDDIDDSKIVDLQPDIEIWRGNLIQRFSHSGDRAVYNKLTDSITMPAPERFVNVEAYYATLFHECVHWTGHESRLNRKLEYGQEELVAELGAAFLCRHWRIDSAEVDENTASYLAGWVGSAKLNPSYLWDAMSMANLAVNRLVITEDAEVVND